MVWDLSKKICYTTGKIGDKKGPMLKRGASTMSTLPPNQCSRAVAYNPINGHIAVGHNNGMVSIRENYQALDPPINVHKASGEWIECMAYSPDGRKLAVGSHDNMIYLYDVTNNYGLEGKL